MPTTVIILAAGQGKRMRSSLPKVLHRIAGRPMLDHALGAAAALKPHEVRIVHGHGGERVKAAFEGRAITWVAQAEQRGTGHAVKLALGRISPKDVVLVLYADVPLVQPATLRKLVAKAATGKLAVLTAELENPTGYGRILRGTASKGGGIVAIVEEKDASREQRAIREINTGLMACPAGRLALMVGRLKANNAQREYYLTDIIAMAVKGGLPVVAVPAASVDEVMGVNDKVQLAEAERILRLRTARSLMEAGVTLVDPDRVDVHGTLTCGRDVVIHPNVLFEGRVTLGDGVLVEAFSRIRDATVGAGTIIHSHCVIESGEIGPECEIGPYARMRPGVVLVGDAKLGNFVEIKQTTIGLHSKVNHLTYIGDTTIGEKVNVGAGTITCNYDGANKHRTIIGDGAFIGSGVELVAPVEVGAGATIGAGSTITKDAPAGQLTVARTKQAVIHGWKRPLKKR